MNKQFLILTLMCAALLACTANHENLDAMTAKECLTAAEQALACDSVL